MAREWRNKGVEDFYVWLKSSCQLKIEFYNFKMLYVPVIPMVTTKKTSTEDAQKEMKKESKDVTIKTNQMQKKRQEDRK